MNPFSRTALQTRIVAFIWNSSFLLFTALPSLDSAIPANRAEVSDSILAISHDGHTQVSESAFLFAKQLIEQSRLVADLRKAWGEHQPSAQEENEFIRQHGFAEYAKWHLGIDDRHAENTKARYKFPFGNFKNIHRSALLAAKNRARQYGYGDIENAATRLLEMIEAKGKDQRLPAVDPVSFQAVKNASINSGKSSL